MTNLVCDDHGSFATLRFDGPGKLNAFSYATYASLGQELDRFAREPRWRALILTGAGRAFCSGQDLDEATQAEGMSPADMRARLEMLQQLTRRMLALPKLLIAAINGPAVGFGAELTLACDIRFASADAYFMFPELSRSLYFTNATLELLPALAGDALACDLLLSGRRWSAAEALAAGFVSRVLPGPDLLTETRRFVEHTLRAPSDTLQATIAYVRGRRARAIEPALRYEIDTFLAMSAALRRDAATERATGEAT
jgi:enoyl-CoA hydratase/carnithine racemase